MDLIDLETLLQPLSDDAPCGPDLEYDAAFGEMERAAESKADQQYGDTIVAAEPPDWKDVQKRALSLLARTKDMRVVVTLARSALEQTGLAGFAQAIELLRGYVETFWDSVHPELDHDDNDDPTYRTNTLITLCDDETVLRELRDAPLVSSRTVGRFSLRDWEQASEGGGSVEAPASDSWGDDDSASEPESKGPTTAIIEAAFTDVAIEDVQATEEAARLASEHLTAIETFVTEQVGVSMAVSLRPVRDVLNEMNEVVVSQLKRRGAFDSGEVEGSAGDPDAEAQAIVDPATGAVTVASTASGTPVTVQSYVGGMIGSRKDASKALDDVCDFYELNEPSSPLPLLIRRAQRLASKSFLDILRDLAPDAVATAEALGGGGGDASDPAAAEAAAETEESSSW